MRILLPEKVDYIIKQLNKNGHESFIVGGCVRDSILKKAPIDWDIATNAHPSIIKKIFDKTIDTGIRHGTITVCVGNENYEVTTYRIDGDYINNRKPESVHFTDSLVEDLARRDFTMNAIAYHPVTGIVDPFNGIEDIRNSIIKTVGNPKDRFSEDALRMLRCIRFSAQLGFKIDKSCLNGIKECSSLIKNISSERIRIELTKTLVSDYPQKFLLLHETGLLRYFFKELDNCFSIDQNNPHHIYNVGIHTIKSLENIEKDPALRWTMLLHDLGKTVTKTTDKDGIDHFYGHPEKSMVMAEKVLKRLKFDNQSISKILCLIKYHDSIPEPDTLSVKKFLLKTGSSHFKDLIKIWKADALARNPEYLDRSINKINEIEKIYMQIKSEKIPLSLKELAVNGHDLIAIGFKEGKHVGDILKETLKMVLENPEMNNKEALINYIKERYLS